LRYDALLVSLDDFELLDAWRAGDRGAGNALFDRYFDALFCFFRTKVDDATAEDLVQQTLLKLVQLEAGFRKESSFRTYAFRAARNRLYDFFEARHRRDAAIDPQASSSVDLGGTPSFLGSQREDHKLLLHALRALPLDLQVVLELYYFEKMRARELTEVLELPEGTIRTRLRRGLGLLRERLTELHGEGPRVETTMSNLEGWAEEIRAATLGRAPERP
jgi:RNA polymerase sigma-70 factor (ECF subfamily)